MTSFARTAGFALLFSGLWAAVSVSVDDLPDQKLAIVSRTTGGKLLLIKSGEFMMGSPASDSEAKSTERPQHRVRLTKDYLPWRDGSDAEAVAFGDGNGALEG